MPRPHDLPRLATVGARVRWWRKHRKMSQAYLAKQVGYSQSGLSDLEHGRSDGSERLHLIAPVLGLNPHYLESDLGEPEAAFPQSPTPEPEPWPFEAVPRSRLLKLNRIERKFAETQLLEALAEIEKARREGKKAG